MNLLDKIREIVKDVYETENESFVTPLSCTLLNNIFEHAGALEDIITIALQYETEESVKENGWYLFDRLLELIENNSANAKRMYETFMYSLDDFDLYIKLLDCEKFLTREQYVNAYNKGYKLFDKELLKLYGITGKL